MSDHRGEADLIRTLPVLDSNRTSRGSALVVTIRKPSAALAFIRALETASPG
jgi:hypothetical protein